MGIDVYWYGVLVYGYTGIQVRYTDILVFIKAYWLTGILVYKYMVIKVYW